MRAIRTSTVFLLLAAGLLALTAGCPALTALLGGNGAPTEVTDPNNGGAGGNGDADTNGTSANGDADADGDATSGGNVPAGGLLADHAATGNFASIPSQFVSAAQSGFDIFYGHTSHGSQVVTGIDMIAATHAGFPAVDALNITEQYGDLGTQGDLAWVDVTRDALGQPGNTHNLVVWSWCGGVSENTPEGIDAYLQALDRLEQDYPGVTFVYMTGHLDGEGPGGILYRGNNRIREYCAAHGKVLFDFADIESYDPAGGYYPDGTDWCEWCETWCSTHTCPECTECAHSQCFNCYQKGRAFWWLLARLAGWEGE